MGSEVEMVPCPNSNKHEGMCFFCAWEGEIPKAMMVEIALNGGMKKMRMSTLCRIRKNHGLGEPPLWGGTPYEEDPPHDD